VEIFIRKYPNMLPGACDEKEITLIKAKIFNERNKTRRLVGRHLNSLTV